MEVVISSVITGIVAVIVCIISQHTERQKISKAHIDSMQLIEYKIDTLSERVEKHNQVIARTYALESRADLIEEKIKVANHRIEDLEVSK